MISTDPRSNPSRHFLTASLAFTRLAQSRILPNDFERQHEYAEADDSPNQHYRDKGLQFSLRLTFSCGGCSVQICWKRPLRMTADILDEAP
jgi:hypothetical protein